MNERIEAVVSGRVQMVMFRDSVQRKGSALKLTGEVRNLRDGTVHVLAEGSRPQLEKFIKKLHQGSLLSHVEHVSVSWSEATDVFHKFKIAYD